ncbi:MAG: hypothetical protein ABSE63_06870 [Thermoguttaceae bacterium]|jgi:hypothetical protein
MPGSVITTIRYFAGTPKRKRSADPQRRSSNPDQGAQQNSARPTPHLGAVVPSTASLVQEPQFGSGWLFLWKQT